MLIRCLYFISSIIRCCTKQYTYLYIRVYFLLNKLPFGKTNDFQKVIRMCVAIHKFTWTSWPKCFEWLEGILLKCIWKLDWLSSQYWLNSIEIISVRYSFLSLFTVYVATFASSFVLYRAFYRTYILLTRPSYTVSSLDVHIILNVPALILILNSLARG